MQYINKSLQYFRRGRTNRLHIRRTVQNDGRALLRRTAVYVKSDREIFLKNNFIYFPH